MMLMLLANVEQNVIDDTLSAVLALLQRDDSGSVIAMAMVRTVIVIIFVMVAIGFLHCQIECRVGHFGRTVAVLVLIVVVVYRRELQELLMCLRVVAGRGGRRGGVVAVRRGGRGEVG